MANDFKPFSTSETANVYTNAEYVADTDLANGNQPGIAKSKLVNKALRQCSIISTVVAQFISDITTLDSVDDGTTATLLTNFKNALNSLYVGLTGDQTIAGAKTFSSPIELANSGFTATLQSGTLSGDVVHTLPSTSSNLASEQYVLDNGFTVASTAEAQAGTDNTKGITPLRLREALNASGTAPIYACRAWVNFNGTGTVAIRASGNVSSITDNGVGDYTVNFTTAMVDANYSCVQMGQGGNSLLSARDLRQRGDTGLTTTSVRVHCQFVNEALSDTSHALISIFR